MSMILVLKKQQTKEKRGKRQEAPAYINKYLIAFIDPNISQTLNYDSFLYFLCNILFYFFETL